MAKDIEEFLRRAAERRRQQQGGQSPQPRSPQPPPQQREPVSKSPPLRKNRQPNPLEAIIVDEVEIVEPVKVPSRTDMRKQSVREHVSSHLDSSDIGEHASSLGSAISSVSNRVEAQVHQHLDHDLSKLDDRPTVTDDPPPEIFGKNVGKFRDEIRNALTDPRAVGRSILIAEILKRPDWD